MNKLTLPKKVLAVAGAILLFASASGTALAMMDPGLRSLSAPSATPQSATQAAPQAASASPRSSSGEVEFTGALDVMAATGWVIGGRTVRVTSATEIGAGVQIGSQVKVHARPQADGSLLAREIKLAAPGGNGINGNENGNGNVNSNENENENENGNGNVNDNQNENDDDHGNGNHNENDDDHHGNGNHNENDDDHGGNHNGDD